MTNTFSQILKFFDTLLRYLRILKNIYGKISMEYSCEKARANHLVRSKIVIRKAYNAVKILFDVTCVLLAGDLQKAFFLFRFLPFAINRIL